MFDHIHFLTHNITNLVTQRNLSSFTDTIPKMDHSDRDTITFHSTIQSKNSFILDGQIQLLIPYPLNDFAQMNYFYPQLFCLNHSKEKYFTQRSDYESYLILFTHEGEGILEYEKKTYHLHPNEGFFIDCRKPHYYCTSGASWFHSDLHINGSILPHLYEEFAQNGSVIFKETTYGTYQTLLAQLLTIWDSNTPYRELMVSNSISNLIAHLLIESKNSKGNSAILENIRYLIRYMENNYTSDLSLDFLSRFSGISKYHLTREFKKYTGFPPNEYLIQLRIERAKFLLINTNASIPKIAEEVGIHNVNNFTNLFKKHIGMTPNRFRRGVK